MFDLDKYLADLIMNCRSAFGERLLYIGLQGSWLRGEAHENSDIDIMVILDRLVRHNEQPQPDGTLRSTLAISNGKSLVYVWAIIIAWMVLLAGDGSSSFIYFQF